MNTDYHDIKYKIIICVYLRKSLSQLKGGRLIENS